MDCSTPGFSVHHQLPRPTPTCSNPCPLSQWCHPTISSSVVPFSSCLQSFPASGSFPMSQFSASGGQSIGASASASILPKSIQGWFSLRLTGLISLLSKGLSRVFFSTSLSSEYSGLICFRIDFFGLPAVQGALKSLIQHHSSKTSILWCSALFIVQLLHLYMTMEPTGKPHIFHIYNFNFDL